jgi:hypothetical protein
MDAIIEVYIAIIQTRSCFQRDYISYAAAAMYGHLELLKGARAHQCPWDEKTCSNAAQMVILNYWNGPEKINVPEMKIHALMLPQLVTLSY